ncbi:MAG: hypothetical protein R8M14_07150 [Ghiorsea sp.]
MKDFIKGIPYLVLILASIFMLLAPLQPEPHLVQKFNMLVQGNLSKPMDLFDVVWHLLPTMLLVLKFYGDKKSV